MDLNPLDWVANEISDPGDTLSAIAQRNDVTLGQLEGANQGRLGNTPDLIYPGQQVLIPAEPWAAG